MKKLTSLLFVLVTCTVAVAQSSDLCQGKYYSEEEGANKLMALQKRMTSLKNWQTHADSVRSRLKKGMEMETFPTKTPLNARFRNKKIMNGYTVESVVFVGKVSISIPFFSLLLTLSAWFCQAFKEVILFWSAINLAAPSSSE